MFIRTYNWLEIKQIYINARNTLSYATDIILAIGFYKLLCDVFSYSVTLENNRMSYNNKLVTLLQKGRLEDKIKSTPDPY